MSSREYILDRIRRNLGRTPQSAETGRAELLGRLAAHPQGPRPLVGEDLMERFVVRSLALASTVDQVGAMDEAPGAARRYLAGNGLPTSAVCAGDLAHLPWTGAGMSIEVRAARDEDLVGITGCFCAIAETGTLMLCSSRGSPGAVSLLPETHIALVPASRIVTGMEDAWNLARHELEQLPRAVNFVSGPSRTGDIEQTIVLGAHGPYRVHLIVVRDA